ncbi:BON domain-containing protein [Desulfobulbus rhabdoformis]|uniref:BON domain-containing protein n=1 Tax=Desulfobulbus rhabdoformis TaxID=34032 RepID=UPI0019650D8B|nr:BON domain-containing protein [Desulfobulbus rhabdoformis]MBM9614993.1 BON domain-containing protein [Desulfobulbus rhabdoformis]
MKRHPFVSIICTFFLFFLLVGCTTPAGRSTGQVIDDASITTQVKAELVADKEVSALTVSVKTFQGEVVLSGAVETIAQRRKAAAIAHSVRGVRRVTNLLKLKTQ